MDYVDKPWDTSMNTILTQLPQNEISFSYSFLNESFNASISKNVDRNNPFFGLPDTVKLLFQKYKGITTLYDWQKDCLQLDAIKKRDNLVYSLPTSGGKTLVAEILMLYELLIRNKNVIFVLPYVALAQEKVRSLSPFGLDLGFYVDEYVGGKGTYPPIKHRKKRTLYVCTIEKASGLVESFIQYKRLNDEIGMVVVDEVHLIGDKSRGVVLEALLTKLMYIANDIQIISMSATIGNLDEVAKFLKAKIYTHDFRPVELTEYVKCDNNLYKVVRNDNGYSNLKLERKMELKCAQELRTLDPSCLGVLVQEVIPNESCLVFCSTKKSCSNFAILICRTATDRNLKDFKKEEKLALLRALEEEGQGNICPILKKTIPYGIAYHHSGLTNAERKLLEEAFISGTICCICCTSTLAAGVNLPAKRVIIFSPYVGRDFLRLSSYKQMSGRAGRMGFTDAGQSILVCQKSEMPQVAKLLESTMDFCESTLDSNGLNGLIVSAVGLEIAKTQSSLYDLLMHSLLYVQASGRKNDIDTKQLVDNSLKQLEDLQAITKDPNTCEYCLTTLANAAMTGNLSISEARMLMEDLEEAVTNGLILRNYLHLFYLITPYSAINEINLSRDVLFSLLTNMSEAEKKIASRLGITEGAICRFITLGTIKSVPERVWKRFILSLIIFSLWNSNSLWNVSNKFDISRGDIHSFLMRTAAFASSIQRFTEALKMEQFDCFPMLLQKIIPRIAHCCTVELLQLMQLPAVKIGRAQQLFKAGYKTLNDIANVNPQVLVSSIDHLPRRVAYEIVATAKLLMLQKAEMLQEEADSIKADLNAAAVIPTTSTPSVHSNSSSWLRDKSIRYAESDSSTPVSIKKLKV